MLQFLTNVCWLSSVQCEVYLCSLFMLILTILQTLKIIPGTL